MRFGLRVTVSETKGMVEEEFSRRSASGFSETLAAAERRARKFAPKKTGKLRKGITAGRYDSGNNRGYLHSAAPYSSYLHRGTGMYGPKKRVIIIRPKYKEALWWETAEHPVSIVYSGGIKPRGFLRKATSPENLETAFKRGFSK